MELDNNQKKEVFDLFMSSKEEGFMYLRDLLYESGVTKPNRLRKETRQLTKETLNDFADDGSYIKQHIEDNHSSDKEDEKSIYLNQDGKMVLQPSISGLANQTDKIEEMAEILGVGFKESFSENRESLLSQLLVDSGQAKKVRDTSIVQLGKYLKQYFRVENRKIADSDISNMLTNSRGIPDKSDVSLAMGQGKTFQKTKARVMPILYEASQGQYKQAVLPFLDRLSDTIGTNEKKELFKFSAGTLFGDKNLRFTEDRKDIYRYWESVNDTYDDFKNALDDVIALDFDSLESLNNFKGEDLNYIFKFEPYDAQYGFPPRTKRVLDGLDAIVDELEDYRRVDQRKFETEVGYMGDTRTAQEAAGMGYDLEDLDGITSEIEQLKEYQKTLEETKNDIKHVDPLYKYMLENKKDLFGDPEILEEEIREFRKLAKRGITLVYDLDFDETITDWLDELSKTATAMPEKAVYLPMNNIISSLSANISASDVSTKKRNIAKFLDAVSKLVMAEEPTGTIRDRLVNLASFEGTPSNIPSGGKKKLDTLIQKISEFFFRPLVSSYYPFADALDFRDEIDSNTDRLFAIITSNSSNITEDAYLSIINQELQDAAFLDISVVDEISILLENATSPDAKSNLIDFAEDLERLHAMLIPEVFQVSPNGSIIGEEGKEELGDYYKSTLDENDIKYEVGGKPLTIFDKPVKTWTDSGDSGPVRSVINHILRREDSYRALDDEEKIETFGKAIDRLKGAKESMRIIKSDIELDLLQTHDSIRKMLGKPVHYNTSKLDNFEHVNSAMTILKREYNLDVSAIEVDNIINDFGSMEDIATKHGVSPESVYFLKGNFR